MHCKIAHEPFKRRRNTSVFCAVFHASTAAEKMDTRLGEEALLNYLFDGYNPTARPVLNSSLTVAVNLRFSLLQIQDLVILCRRFLFVRIRKQM